MPDDIDKCPNTPKGVKVNAIGCWELRDVNFDVDMAVIKNAQVWDEVVAILKINPTMTGEVRGYTDSAGSLCHNQKISEARAKAVRDYLIKQGMCPSESEPKGSAQLNRLPPMTQPKGAPEPPRGTAPGLVTARVMGEKSC